MADVRFVVTSVSDAGGDILLIKGQDTTGGNEVSAEGWVSATTNHFDVVNGVRKGPRVMTPTEVGEYALAKLEDSYPEPAPEPSPVEFVSP